MVSNNHRQLIGSLQYVALATRIDLSFAITKLALFLTDRSRPFGSGATHPTIPQGYKRLENIPWRKYCDIEGFTDSDWRGDRDDHKTIGAYAIMEDEATNICNSFIRGGKVHGHVPGCEGGSLAYGDFGINLQVQIVIFGNNQGSIAPPQTHVLHVRSKHIAIPLVSILTHWSQQW